MMATKMDGEEIRERHKKQGTEPPELFPDPDQILMNPETGNSNTRLPGAGSKRKHGTISRGSKVNL